MAQSQDDLAELGFAADAQHIVQAWEKHDEEKENIFGERDDNLEGPPDKRARIDPEGEAFNRKLHNDIIISKNNACMWELHNTALSRVQYEFGGDFSHLNTDVQLAIRENIEQQLAKELTERSELQAIKARENRPLTFDLIGAMCSRIELAVELGKYLPPRDAVKLFSISRDFHDSVSFHMRSTIRAWTAANAPKASRIFAYTLFRSMCIHDPAGRPNDPEYYKIVKQAAGLRIGGAPAPLPAEEVERRERVRLAHMAKGIVRPKDEARFVPSLRWYQMVVHNEKCVRDILACLARSGHRCPPGTDATLMKLWLLMHVAVSAQRLGLMRSRRFFADADLFRAQLFLVKLHLRLNHPAHGPHVTHLAEVMLGQRSLVPLRDLLRGRGGSDAVEAAALRAKLRYHVPLLPEEVRLGRGLYGVPLHERNALGREGWGRGAKRLVRPDEMVAHEAARRELALDGLLADMALHGHIDMKTGESGLLPGLDEMYMSDDELPDLPPERHADPLLGGCGNVPFDARADVLPWHARKARWATLSQHEKAVILAAGRNEMLDAEADTWHDELDDETDDNDEEPGWGARMDIDEDDLTSEPPDEGDVPVEGTIITFDPDEVEYPAPLNKERIAAAIIGTMRHQRARRDKMRATMGTLHGEVAKLSPWLVDVYRSEKLPVHSCDDTAPAQDDYDDDETEDEEDACMEDVEDNEYNFDFLGHVTTDHDSKNNKNSETSPASTRAKDRALIDYFLNKYGIQRRGPDSDSDGDDDSDDAHIGTASSSDLQAGGNQHGDASNYDLEDGSDSTSEGDGKGEGEDGKGGDVLDDETKAIIKYERWW